MSGPPPPAATDASPGTCAGNGGTAGTLLGGKVDYRQAPDGFRTGIEPVLLAASVPARPGQSVLEAGMGAGAGLLCLAARVPSLSGCGVERDASMAELGRRNLEANGHAAFAVEVADITAWRSAQRYDHAFANPPWHKGGTRSPTPGREAAKQAHAGLLRDWAISLGQCLHRRGTLSMVVPAASAAEAMAAMAAAHCGELTLIPLWPHAGQPARLAIVRGIREGRGGTTLHAGLVLHQPEGGYTQDAAAILRDGAPLG